MEDYATVVQEAQCGFLYAGPPLTLPPTYLLLLLSCSISRTSGNSVMRLYVPGVFDGHQGPGAAEYLHEKLYNSLAEVIQTAVEAGNSGSSGMVSLCCQSTTQASALCQSALHQPHSLQAHAASM